MLTYTLNREQLNALDGLAYWVADLHYMREKWGADDPELDIARYTIKNHCFPALDRLQVPFWVQNSVIAWAENWRRYKSEYFRQYLESKNIFVA